MNNYTVLLLRPDYVADEFGKDTYLAHVTAADTVQAMARARYEAWNSDIEVAEDELDLVGHPDDYHVLFCTMGHLRDLSRDQT